MEEKIVTIKQGKILPNIRENPMMFGLYPIMFLVFTFIAFILFIVMIILFGFGAVMITLYTILFLFTYVMVKKFSPKRSPQTFLFRNEVIKFK